MSEIRRKGAAAGLSLLASIMLLIVTGTGIVSVLLPAAAAFCALLLIFRRRSAVWVLIFCLSLVTGALLLDRADKTVYEPSLLYTGENISVSGTAADYPSFASSSQKIRLKNCSFNGIKTKYNLEVYYSDGSYPEPGDEISFTASEIFSSADSSSRYFRHSLSDRLWLSAFAQDSLSVASCEKQTIPEKLMQIKHYAQQKISAAMSDENAAVTSALLTGDQTDIPDRIKNNFRLSGIAHIFAVSGMHLTMWSGLIFAVFRKRSRRKLLPNFAVVIFVFLYAIFTGLSPSVLRAGIMLIILCAGSVFRQPADPLNSLGLSAVILLVMDPWLGGNLSFLMSFMSTFALVAVFPLFSEDSPGRISALKRFIRNKRNDILLSLTVLFTSIPLTAFFFGYITMLAPLTSLICTPLAQLLMIFSAAGSLLPARFIITKGAFAVSSALADAIIKITETAASCEWAVCSLRKGYIIIWFILSVLLLLFVKFRLHGSGKAMLNTGLALSAAVLIIGIIGNLSAIGDYRLYIPDGGNSTFLSLVSESGNSSMIIGCGGDYASYSAVKDSLHGKAVFSADYMIVPRNSRAESDRLPNALEDFRPKNLILPENSSVSGADNCRILYTDAYSASPFEGVTIGYRTNGNACTGVLTVNGKRIVFCLYPGSVLPEGGHGDYLICRGMIPDTADAGAFGSIIVLSDKSAEELHLPPNAVSTADTGGNEIKLPKLK